MKDLFSLLTLVLCIGCGGSGGSTPAEKTVEPTGPDLTQPADPTPTSPVNDPSPVTPPNSSDDPTSGASNPTPTPSPTPVPHGTISATVTAYRFQTLGSRDGVHPVTLDASCLVYLTKTYCMDNGPRGTGDGITYFSFFGVTAIYHYAVLGGSCLDNCFADVFDNKYVLITPTLLSEMSASNPNAVSFVGHTYAYMLPDDVLRVNANPNHPLPTNYNCSDDGSTLDCGTFTVDITQ